MTKTEAPIPFSQRLTKKARNGSDRERALYVATRRVLAPGRTIARTVAARRSARDADFTIPSDRGFVVYGPDRFPEAPQIAELAQRRLAEADIDKMRERGQKSFLIGILDQASLTRESPLVRLALRDDVLRAIAGHLGVVPILWSIDLFYSRAAGGKLRSSQLLHCDGDDTQQIKIFVLCTKVDESKGPLMIMDAVRSKTLRRRLGFTYNNRVTDEEAQRTLGDVGLTALVGEPGTVGFVDTSRCFHFGSRVESRDEGRLVAIFQYVTPYSFKLPREHRDVAPYRHLAVNSSSKLERLVLGAS